MVVDESLNNILRTVAHLKSKSPETYDKEPAVVAAPTWWIDLVSKMLAPVAASYTDEATELDSVHGCKVIRRDDLPEPVTISAGGTTYPVLPAWARKANKGEVQ